MVRVRSGALSARDTFAVGCILVPQRHEVVCGNPSVRFKQVNKLELRRI